MNEKNYACEDMSLNLQSLPEYILCEKRSFIKNEYHCTRITDYDVLIIMLKGKLIFEENGKHVELKKNDWYIQRSGLFQTAKEASEEPEYYYVHFRADFIFSPSTDRPICGRITSPEVFEEIEKLYNEEHSVIKKELVCYSHFYSVLTMLNSPKLTDESNYSVGNKIEKYILNHYTKTLSLNNLAEEFGYSVNYIIRFFKKYSGVTPHRYVTDLRVSLAQKLLSDSEMSFEEIASSVGYSDTSTLYRAFVAKTGCSPKEFRKQRMNKL